MRYLQEQQWPGNIRELENVVQRLMITAKGARITLLDVMMELEPGVYRHLDPPGSQDSLEALEKAAGTLPLEALVDNFEKQLILYAAQKYGSSRKAAKALGISQTQYVRKKNKYDPQ